MRTRKSQLLCLIGLLLLVNTCSSLDGEWIALFNGEDLRGWEVECTRDDEGREFWTVENGAIVANSMGHPEHDYVWLMHRNEYENFELKLKFQAYRNSPGNSGVQIRSRFDDRVDAPNGGWMNGPQVDIHPLTPWRIGLIYDETREERRWIYPDLEDWQIDKSYAPDEWEFYYSDEYDGWNELRIVCDRTKIKTILNGIVMADYDGKEVLDNEAHRKHQVGMNGHIAFQMHSGDELIIKFKDIFLRQL